MSELLEVVENADELNDVEMMRAKATENTSDTIEFEEVRDLAWSATMTSLQPAPSQQGALQATHP